MTRTRFGGALPKVLLLILAVVLLVGYFVWKSGFGVIGAVQPIPGSTANMIAFVRRDGGVTNLYLVNADGAGERQLTDDKAEKRTPAWSPDGKQLCYSAEVRDEGGTTNQLFLKGGGDARVLTRGSGSKDMPAWRPDGKQIAYLSGGMIKLVDSNGNQQPQIYPPAHKETGQGQNSDSQDQDEAGMKQPPIQSFKWSPNGVGLMGLQITEGIEAPTVGQPDWWQQGGGTPGQPQQQTVAEPETLMLIPSLDAKPQIMTSTNAKELGFDWLPDGSHVAVTLTLHGGAHGIGIFRTDDVSLPPEGLMTSVAYGLAAKNPAVSPDGTMIAFEAWRVTSAEDSSLLGIAVMPLDTSHPLMIRSAADLSKLPLKIAGPARYPQWSPDSKRLLYVVQDARGSQVWVANADGSNKVQVTKKGDNFDAVWSPARK